MKLWTHCRITTMSASATVPYGFVEEGAIVVEGEYIVWAGAQDALPGDLLARCTERVDAGGRLATPGLIDCHTHLVYGGDRANEFELRLKGATYEEIARSGGGIASTVKATRAATEEDLVAQSLPRLQALMREGVTTIEIKSGYGLSLEHERKCLRAARSLGTTQPIDVRTTFLGAHALPTEFAGRADDYIDAVIEMLPSLKQDALLDAVDAFCERIAFSTSQVERLFDAAEKLAIPVKLHAEQLSDSGGTQLASRYKALSCDHLEWLSEEGAVAMAYAGTVAVLLPGAFYFLRETKLPPLDLLREHKVPIAISTDCNPGSSPCTSLLLMLNMACTLFRMTPEEALAGVTRNAARALGLTDRGVIEAGKRADFVLWDVQQPAQLAYTFGLNPQHATIYRGESR